MLKSYKYAWPFIVVFLVLLATTAPILAANYVWVESDVKGVGDNLTVDISMPFPEESEFHASTIYVPENYTLIQEAVDAASPGDTIIVREGTYEENIGVYKRLTIRSENGPDSTIVQAEYPELPVFEVAADYVNLSGFTVKGAYEGPGIYLYSADYCFISNNICSENEGGILLMVSENNDVSNNNCPSNNCSIYLTDSANNSVSGNVCSYSSGFGIYIEESTNNSISNNNWTYNFAGICLCNSSDNNSIFKNNCSDNVAGIFPLNANNNDIYLNNFMNNDLNAASLESSNIWCSPSKITYTYNGKTYTNYLGNYWDDYSRSDNDNDGIGDSSYRIDGNRDRYPLMEPWEKYFI